MSDYKSGSLVVLGLLVLAASLAVVAFVWRPLISLRTQSPPAEPRLAVLAFENLSGDPDLELVASELAPAVAGALAGTGRFELVESLGLAPTVEREGLEEAARKLGADFVVTGSVDRTAEAVVVDAYFFRAGSEPGLWVERLVWSPEEKDAVASELARRIERGFGSY